MTYIFLQLRIRHGEYEFYTFSVHRFNDKRDMNTFADAYAEHYYSGEGVFGDGGYYFNAGEVHVSVWQTQEILEEEYNILKNYI